MFVLGGGSGLVLSPVPECEGPGAPGMIWASIVPTGLRESIYRLFPHAEARG